MHYLNQILPFEVMKISGHKPIRPSIKYGWILTFNQKLKNEDNIKPTISLSERLQPVYMLHWDQDKK